MKLTSEIIREAIGALLKHSPKDAAGARIVLNTSLPPEQAQALLGANLLEVMQAITVDDLLAIAAETT